jgi:hypothetical protein
MISATTGFQRGDVSSNIGVVDLSYRMFIAASFLPGFAPSGPADQMIVAAARESSYHARERPAHACLCRCTACDDIGLLI